eukprot:853255-Amphidinium_carterae.1
MRAPFSPTKSATSTVARVVMFFLFGNWSRSCCAAVGGRCAIQHSTVELPQQTPIQGQQQCRS